MFRSMGAPPVNNGSRGIASGLDFYGDSDPSDIRDREHRLYRFSSCSPNELSWKGGGNISNGIFTHFIIQGLLGGQTATNVARSTWMI